MRTESRPQATMGVLTRKQDLKRLLEDGNRNLRTNRSSSKGGIRSSKTKAP